MSQSPNASFTYKENETYHKARRISKCHKAFISEYLSKNQKTFEEVMEEVRLGNPRRWAELYVEMTKMVIPKEANVNVNVGINKDFRDLHLLATTMVLEQKKDGELVEQLKKLNPVEDVDYEMMPKELDYAEEVEE